MLMNRNYVGSPDCSEAVLLDDDQQALQGRHARNQNSNVNHCGVVTGGVLARMREFGTFFFIHRQQIVALTL
jgi:hypothetical protein